MNGMRKCIKRKIDSEYEAKKIKERMQLHQKTLFKYYFHDECNCYHIAHLVPKNKILKMLKEANYDKKTINITHGNDNPLR
jgi:hypothetical protein